jgi:hypothetical protein
LKTFISTNGIFLNIHYFSFTTIFFDLEEIVFENFKISENNIISVELAKVLKVMNVNTISFALVGKAKN